MRFIAVLAFVLLASGLLFPFTVTKTREEMLDFYYRHVDDKVPKTARMLLGDEKINVYIGSSLIGIETTKGQLKTFETYELERPTIVVRVSEEAAGRISSGEEGVLAALDNGGIKVEGKNIFAAIKVEALKRIYAVSGADQKITGKKSASLLEHPSVLLQRVRIQA